MFSERILSIQGKLTSWGCREWAGEGDSSPSPARTELNTTVWSGLVVCLELLVSLRPPGNLGASAFSFEGAVSYIHCWVGKQ